MALVETFDGRWFPAFAPDVTTSRWLLLLGDATTTLIPPALDPLIDPYHGYDCPEQAIEAYLAWHEAAVLSVDWQELAAHTEVYPERNAWYLDEITLLTENDTPLRVYGTYAFATVTTTHHGAHEVITARGATPDETIEALYQHVYEWCCQQHTLYQHVS